MFPTIVEFEVPGKPQGKQRPKARVIECNGPDEKHRLSLYTPKETVEFERAVGWCARQVYRGREPDDGAVGLEVVAVWPWPKSMTKKRRAELQAQLYPGYGLKPSKPDFDNVEKAVADALEGIAYTTDGRIAFGRGMTLWGDGKARTLVRVYHGDVLFSLSQFNPWWAKTGIKQ